MPQRLKEAGISYGKNGRYNYKNYKNARGQKVPGMYAQDGREKLPDEPLDKGYDVDEPMLSPDKYPISRGDSLEEREASRIDPAGNKWDEEMIMKDRIPVDPDKYPAGMPPSKPVDPLVGSNIGGLSDQEWELLHSEKRSQGIGYQGGAKNPNNPNEYGTLWDDGTFQKEGSYNKKGGSTGRGRGPNGVL